MKKLFFLSIISVTILFFVRCMNVKSVNDPRGQAYAGSSACSKCHQPVCESYVHTAHYKSACPASESSIAGSFAKDSNTFIVNDSMKVVMEKQDDLFFQVLYVNGKIKEAQRFDIAFGSVKGQSYLYWKNDLVFQLPVSYISALHSWTSSPGYFPGDIDFNRPIVERCFECHSAFIKKPEMPVSGVQLENALDKNSLIYNIDCERCHGAAAAHVQFHTDNPEQKEAKYIVSFKSLSRSQKIGMCAICHSGNKNVMLKSTFAFKPGDTLSNFVAVDMMTPSHPDVHGNQTQLLSMSKCFQNSNMDCSSCHNTHVNDRGNYMRYAQHCQSCHTQETHNFCKIADSSNISFLKSKCTRCHMPLQPSGAIVVQATANKLNIPTLVANHKIAVYPEESKKIMEGFKPNNHE